MSLWSFHAPFPRVFAPRLVLMGFKQRADGRLLAANLASLALVRAIPPPLLLGPIAYVISLRSVSWLGNWRSRSSGPDLPPRLIHKSGVSGLWPRSEINKSANSLSGGR